MNFTVYCTDCGRPLATTEDMADEDAAKCEKCGSMLEFHVRRDTALIRLKTYATMQTEKVPCTFTNLLNELTIM